MIVLLREPATSRQLARMLEDWRVLIKVVADPRREIAAGGGGMHVDGAALLLLDGSRREDLWGVTWFPEGREVRTEALINVRPFHGNRWVRIESFDTRARVEALVRRLLEGQADPAARAQGGSDTADPEGSDGAPTGAPRPTRDLKALREGFLRDPIPARLAALATTLNRVAPAASYPGHAQAVAEGLDEARHFIEWTGADLDSETVGELVSLQLALTLWLQAWPEAQTVPVQRVLLGHEAARWSDRLRALAGATSDVVGKRG